MRVGKEPEEEKPLTEEQKEKFKLRRIELLQSLGHTPEEIDKLTNPDSM